MYNYIVMYRSYVFAFGLDVFRGVEGRVQTQTLHRCQVQDLVTSTHTVHIVIVNKATNFYT